MKRARIESPGGCFFVLHVFFPIFSCPKALSSGPEVVEVPTLSAHPTLEVQAMMRNQWVPVQRFHKEWKMKMNDGDFLKVVVS